MSRYTENLYDVGAFFDRAIPTRNEFFDMVGSPKAPVPEGMSYEQRLKNMFPTGSQPAPTSVQDKIQAQVQSVAELQKRLALMKMAEDARTPGQDVYVGDKNMQPGWDEIPKGTSMLPKPNYPGELFRFTKNPELFNQDGGQPSAPNMDGYARDNLRAETAQMAAAPTLETQIQNINAQTMQAANGKAQEGATMSDLQRMAQAYFGGRTKEQKQQEMFMNIAAGLASGKSPRFMDNLGSAVGGALTFNRDDTNRREKEALEGFIKIQGQDDARSNNQMDNEVQQEQNRIGWANNNGRLKQLDTQAKYLAKMAKIAQDSGQDASPYIVRLSEINAQMGELGSMGGGESSSTPAASADIVYDKVGSGLKKAGEK